MSVFPNEVPKCAKARLGIVGPGSEENQRLNNRKFEASVVITGTFSGGKQYMMIRGERGNHRDFLRREAVHDVVRVRNVVLLLVIRLDEALHVGSGGAGIAENLQVHVRIVVPRIGLELALIFRQRLDRRQRAGGVGIRLGAVHSVDAGILRHHVPEQMIEGTVFHHQHDDVLELVDSGLGHQMGPLRDDSTSKLHSYSSDTAAADVSWRKKRTYRPTG